MAHADDQRRAAPILINPPELVRRTADRFGPIIAAIDAGTLAGILLIVSAVAALICANSGAHDWYEHFLESSIAVTVNEAGLDWNVHLWVNDGLMSLFFLMVGLEIRREVMWGELASLTKVAGPAIAALGGMVGPVAVFLAFNWGDGEALNGWAIPMATDIAFSLAVLRALGNRVPIALKLFLTALAIIDDLGAIIVIALFYTETVNLAALVAAGGVWVLLFLLGRTGFRPLAPYLLGGLVLWYFTMRSGIHPTLAGVALAFAVPMNRGAHGVAFEHEAPAEILESYLNRWVAFVIMPLFGFTNAGLSLGDLSANALADPLVPGIALGLFAGKQIGVFGATWAAVKLGVAKLPGRMSLGHLYGLSLLCGIGFTMSLFIGDMAFRDHPREAEARLAILLGSVVSALVGLFILWLTTLKPKPTVAAAK